eukprot:9060205-Heterocapsa_arctica.AAC.1
MPLGTTHNSRNGPTNTAGNRATITSSCTAQTTRMADIFAWTAASTTQNEGTLYTKNTCTGAPNRKGHAALQAVGNHQPLRRSHIRRDAKLASGMGLEAAGRRLPGFDRNVIL